MSFKKLLIGDPFVSAQNETTGIRKFNPGPRVDFYVPGTIGDHTGPPFENVRLFRVPRFPHVQRI
jgi:hypothetical protein